MFRARKGDLIRLRRDVVRTRLAFNAAREELIEAAGDWICGSGSAPSPEDLRMLEDLYQAHQNAEARYLACITAVSESVVAQAQRARP